MFVISTVEEKIQDGMMVKKRVRTVYGYQVRPL